MTIDVDQSFAGWLASAAASQKEFRIKHVYVDMLGGLVDGAILSRIMYWHAPAKSGRPRLTVRRASPSDPDGPVYAWLAKSYAAWDAECRVSKRAARDSIARMVKIGLIETAVFQFNGSRMLHIRVVPAVFYALLAAVSDGEIEDVRERLASDAARRLQSAKAVVCKATDPSLANDGSGITQVPESHAPYTTVTPTATPTVTDDLRSSSSTSNDDDDDECAVLRSALTALGFAEGQPEAAYAIAADQALALVWTAAERAKTNPGGLFVTMLDRGQVAEPSRLTLARTALEAGNADEDAARLSVLDALNENEEAQQIAELASAEHSDDLAALLADAWPRVAVLLAEAGADEKEIVDLKRTARLYRSRIDGKKAVVLTGLYGARGRTVADQVKTILQDSTELSEVRIV